VQFKTGGDLIRFSAPKVKMVIKMKFFRAMDRKAQRSGPSSKGVVRSAFGGTASSSSSTFSENVENSRATIHGRIGVLSRSTVQLTSHPSSVMFWMLMVLVNGTSSSSCVDRWSKLFFFCICSSPFLPKYLYWFFLISMTMPKPSLGKMDNQASKPAMRRVQF